MKLQTPLSLFAFATLCLAQGSLDSQLRVTSTQWHVQAYDSYPAGQTCAGNLVAEFGGSGDTSSCIQPSGNLGAQCYIASTKDGSTCTLTAYRGDFNSGVGDPSCVSEGTSVKFKFHGPEELFSTSYSAKSLRVVC